MADIEMYSKQLCPFCVRAKRLMDSLGLDYQEISIDGDRQGFQHMVARSMRRTVPQVFVGDHHIGGSDELHRAVQNGELAKLLAADAQTQNR